MYIYFRSLKIRFKNKFEKFGPLISWVQARSHCSPSAGPDHHMQSPKTILYRNLLNLDMKTYKKN